MRTFEFTLVVDGIDLADPAHVDALIAGGCDDALLVARDGVTMLAFAREADNAEAALSSAVEDVEAAVLGALVTRLDADLVSTSDIAERLERSRESVRLLVEGKRGPGGFSCPVGWVGDGIRVWRWADVHDWGRRNLRFDDGTEPIDAITATLFNSVLAERGRDLAIDFKVHLLQRLRPVSLVSGRPVAVEGSVGLRSGRYRIESQVERTRALASLSS